MKVDIKRMCEPGALCPFHRFDELKGNHFAAATKVGNRFKYSEIDKKRNDKRHHRKDARLSQTACTEVL